MENNNLYIPESFEIVVTGRVQGVGYRHFAHQTALNLGINGWVRNQPDDSVLIIAQADPEVIDTFIDFLYLGPTRSRVVQISKSKINTMPIFDTFSIRY
jgi:acylphosphatase